jgi:hypothetical protein
MLIGTLSWLASSLVTILQVGGLDALHHHPQLKDFDCPLDSAALQVVREKTTIRMRMGSFDSFGIPLRAFPVGIEVDDSVADQQVKAAIVAGVGQDVLSFGGGNFHGRSRVASF